MQIDKSDYYPKVPGYSCDPDVEESNVKTNSEPEAVAPIEEKAVSGDKGTITGHDGQGGLSGESENLIDKISHFLSWVLVPLLIPAYATIMILWLSQLNQIPLSTKWAFISVVFLFTSVIPMVLVLILKRFGIVEDVGLNGRKERLIPYIITICSFLSVAWFFNSKGMPTWVTLFYVGGAVAGFVNMLVNFSWKISAHAAGIAGVVALLLIIGNHGLMHEALLAWIIVTVLLCGLLGSARVWLGRHTPAQVICGFAVGFLSVYLIQYL